MEEIKRIELIFKVIFVMIFAYMVLSTILNLFWMLLLGIGAGFLALIILIIIKINKNKN